jgi:isopenicillin N synthase-like dioxygenase
MLLSDITMLTTQTIPVLDLSDFQATGDRRQQFIDQLGAALQHIGFFALIHHGVDAELIAEAYRLSEQFFSLPEAIKQGYEIAGINGQRGFTSFGKEHAKDHPMPDLKEFWHIGRESPDESPDKPCERSLELRSLTLPNVQISEVPNFHPTMVHLYSQLEACAAELLQACALYLHEPENLMVEMIQGGDTILRIIHYPPISADAHPASLRSAPHEDINLITLLCEATADGLELQQRDGSWLTIPALPGQIIVDSGDMLQQLTNGLLKSTTHRVVNARNDRDRRFSMPFFVHPRPEVDLTPLPSCIAQTGTQKFPAIIAGDYLMKRLREIGLA